MDSIITNQQTAAFREASPPSIAHRALGFRERGWVPWLLLLLDAVVVETCLLLAIHTRAALAIWFPAEIDDATVLRLALGVLVLPLAHHLAGLHPGYGLGAVDRLRSRVLSTLLVFGILSAWDYLVRDGGWSRGVLAWMLIYTLVLPPLAEAVARAVLMRLGRWGMPVAVLGGGRTGTRVIQALRRQPELGLVPVALFDDDPLKAETIIEGIPVLGPLASAAERAAGIRVGVLAMPGLAGNRLAELASDLTFPHMIVVPNLFGLQSLGVSARDLNGILGIQIKNNLLLRHNRVVKQTLDYLLGVPAFLLSIPALAFLALWICQVSPGSPFYAQKREGKNGRTIRVWKLRTMYPDAELRLQAHLAADPKARAEWERFFKLRDDPRILPRVGSFLRKTSLDELPQLWNVVRGDMSLIGPRPFPQYHLERFSPRFRTLRSSVPHGITGLWQVSARSDGDLEVQEALDTYYIRNWSLWLDLYVLFRTIWVVLRRKGAY